MSSDTSTTSTAHVLKGSCLCGQVSYEITGQPMVPALCHCVNCQKWTGTSSLWVAFYHPNVSRLYCLSFVPVPPLTSLFIQQVRITEGESLIKTYLDTITASTNPVERKFCSNCGGSLLVSPRARPHMLGVLVGGIDDNAASELLKPAVEVWCKDKATWLPEVGSKCFQANYTE
jgi:hypothetical protein